VRLEKLCQRKISDPIGNRTHDLLSYSAAVPQPTAPHRAAGSGYIALNYGLLVGRMWSFIYINEKSNDPIGNRTHDILPYSAAPQPTAPHRAAGSDYIALNYGRLVGRMWSFVYIRNIPEIMEKRRNGAAILGRNRHYPGLEWKQVRRYHDTVL